PGINLVKKPIRQDGLFCVCGNCKNVGADKRSAIRQPAPPDGRFALSGLHALIRQRRYSRIN
ncbi:TPA: hypothetical protein ACGHOC_002441, partial [Salmonella enterica subsp. enterica serovar Bovismorbificans]